uniref:RRM domain-containing protein n=1 Tax=Maylandia zebra TaxID=106582 RepID=A0A3P9BRK9_9CICH
MVKIFIGNLACNATAEELRELFEKYGKVTECDTVKNYGFVHMSNMSELHGWRMNVEMSKGRPKSTTKLHVSNLGEEVTSDVLRAKFEEFGPVVECDIVKDYAFVHMERVEDAMEAISKLDNTAYKGERSGRGDDPLCPNWDGSERNCPLFQHIGRNALTLICMW